MDTEKAVVEQPQHRFTTEQRAILAAAHYIHKAAGCTLAEAAAKLWREEWGDMPPSAVRHCKTWRDRLEETGAVLDAPGRGRPHKLPDDVAREAALLVKAGYEVTPTRGREKLPARRMWFHTIDEAIRLTPRLLDILGEFDISPDHLLRRMHEVDPGLRWRRLDVKVLLSKELREERQRYARAMLERLEREPDLLRRIVWIDQVKIWFWGGKATDVHVWCDAYDEQVDLVVPGCGKLGGKPLCVSLYHGVNAALGAVAHQYTPPTTGFPEEWRQKMYARLPDYADLADADYKVGCAGRNIMLPKVSSRGLHVMVLVISKEMTCCRKAQGSRSAAMYASSTG